jgi:carbamoyltransferase
MYILGISCYYHDSAAVLIRDGQLIAAVEEERFSRKKHDASFPKGSIEFCLKKANIQPSELSYVVFYEKPMLKLERLLLSSLASVPRSSAFFTASMKEWFFDKLWIKSHIAHALSISPDKILFSEHHLSHAASAFFASPFKKAAVLTIDGVGEWTTASWGIGDENRITLKEEIRFPHSLGLLYSVFTAFCGYEVNEGEYKVMGLAPYGKPHYVEKIYQILKLASDGSFSLDLSYFSYHYRLRNIYTKKFEELFGSPKIPSDEVIPYYADIAASIQKVLEDTLVRIASYVRKKSGCQKLCYAGGVALNSKANWEILKRSGFDELYIQPAAGDSGGALGASLWAYHSVLNKKRKFVMKHVYWGQSVEKNEATSFFKKQNIRFHIPINKNLLLEEVVDALSKGKVIGWVQGEFEWGPRSLGHRSILADPRSKEMKEILNRKIKFREGFRPFAPVVLSEYARSYFSVDAKDTHFPFRFMLYVVDVQKRMQEQLGAVTHVDGTARPQIIQREVNETYYDLIEAFGKVSGVPLLVNTSFNLKGEPIVNTVQDAFRTFQQSEIDMLVIDGVIVKKQ